MKPLAITRTIEVPTGHILIVNGEHGPLEMLVLGDYGKDVNLKCDAMGLTREPDPVRHTKLLPLSEKCVITISTQYGCSMGCNFCDVPKVGGGRNATLSDLIGQVATGLAQHPELTHTDRLNLHFARMGEPTWNVDVLRAAAYLAGEFRLKGWGFHPVVSTMMPHAHGRIREFLGAWVTIKNTLCNGSAGLQLSINSTDPSERHVMFAGNAMSLEGIAATMGGLQARGRKFTLNFAVANYMVDPKVLLDYFEPERYIIKLTPMHKTSTAVEAGIETDGDYATYQPYQELERSLGEAGFDVLVFIASREEDEGRITCGNAILSGTEPFTP